MNFRNFLATWNSECGRASIQQLQANRFMIKVDGEYLPSAPTLQMAKDSAARRVYMNDSINS